MIYLDYAASTPVNQEVLKTFCDVSASYIANPNSPHQLGRSAKSRLDLATEQIAELFGVKSHEIIYTSGATESNNLAIKGIANEYKKYGKHIITSYLEHASVTSTVTALQNIGYEVDFVDVLDNGLIDLGHLKELLRPDTILVSIGYVDSELGIKQPIDEIGTLLSEYPHCFFHVDATQAVGKIPLSLAKVDLVSFAAHKFYGLEGCGVLIKKEPISLQPLIHGGISTTVYRSGTPMPALAAATAKALTLVFENLETSTSHVCALTSKVKDILTKYPKVHINSTKEAVPHILNLSLKGANASDFQAELEKFEVYLSTKSACCTPNTISRPVYAVTKDRKRALSTLRISLSHLTTLKEIEDFLYYFDECYRKLLC